LSLIATLEAAIDAVDAETIAALYRAENRHPPSFLWNPTPADLPLEKLIRPLALWNSLRGPRDLPRFYEFDPLDLHQIMGYLNWLEPVDDGADFRYRVYGSQVAHRSGYELTGKCVGDMLASPLSKSMVIAGHRAVLRRRVPLLSVHVPEPNSNTTQWTRLILPFADRSDTACRLLAVNLPGDWREPGPGRLPRLYPSFL